MDTILRNARIADGPDAPLVDIGIAGGRIEAIGPGLNAEGEEIELGGTLITPGFIETHIHLDKSCILDRISSQRGGLNEAIGEVARLKQEFTAEDVYHRAKRTLEKCLVNGTTHIRTHLEVDPVIGLRSLEGILPLVEEFRWAIDIEICVFPQEGLLNNPGTDELIVEGLRRGCRLVGAAPYTDTDPTGQIDRVFALAREFDTDIDMHLDFGPDTESFDLDYVCDLTERYGYGGRVAIGHVTKLSALPPERLREKALRLAAAGVAVTVLPATDLYLMGRHQQHSVMRGVAPVHRLLREGVNCSLSTNNVLNPFTPFGDCSLVRMANLYANICQVGDPGDIAECFEMVTTRPARLMRLPDYGIAVGQVADIVALDCESRAAAVSEVVSPIMGFKAGQRTFTRPSAMIELPWREPVSSSLPFGPPDDPLGAFCRENHAAISGSGVGPLAGLTFAAKDVFDIAGSRTGFGNPAWLDSHPPAASTAPAVQRLLDAGADMVGKTITDELTYSLSGQNAHYGTPVNSAAPGRIPGGSSSGSASAVAGELVDLALGTDCGGSVRLPASYCGILGIRPSHGRVSVEGVAPFTWSFDVAGWFARDADVFAAAGRALLDDEDEPAPARRLLYAEDAFGVVDQEVAGALTPAVNLASDTIGSRVDVIVSPDGLMGWYETFRVIQAWEIWSNHAAWIAEAKPDFGPGIRERLEWASRVTEQEAAAARSRRAAIVERIRGLFSEGDVLCLPTSPRVAPPVDAPPDDLENRVRAQAMSLLCIAGLAGLPQVSLPLATLDGLPLGLSLVGPWGTDSQLLSLSRRIMQRV